MVTGRFRSGSSVELQADAAAMRPESPLALLADELDVEPTGDGSEMLRVVMIDHRRYATPAEGEALS
jgi:hypothetical protein